MFTKYYAWDWYFFCVVGSNFLKAKTLKILWQHYKTFKNPRKQCNSSMDRMFYDFTALFPYKPCSSSDPDLLTGYFLSDFL